MNANNPEENANISADMLAFGGSRQVQYNQLY